MTRRGAPRVRRLSYRARRALSFLVGGGVALLLATWIVSGMAPSATERVGIDQLRIQRTASGHLLDLRYRVVEPQRARSLLAKQGPAHVIHEQSGRRLPVPTTPKAGSLRNTGEPQAGRFYFALFANPGGLVRRGDHVSVVLGDLKTSLKVE